MASWVFEMAAICIQTLLEALRPSTDDLEGQLRRDHLPRRNRHSGLELRGCREFAVGQFGLEQTMHSVITPMEIMALLAIRTPLSQFRNPSMIEGLIYTQKLRDQVNAVALIFLTSFRTELDGQSGRRRSIAAALFPASTQFWMRVMSSEHHSTPLPMSLSSSAVAGTVSGGSSSSIAALMGGGGGGGGVGGGDGGGGGGGGPPHRNRAQAARAALAT